MWDRLSFEDKNEYKLYILAFASLSELMSQKTSNVKSFPVVIPSKFQEKTFCKVFNAEAEDINNTSYDASLIVKEGKYERKYLVGIKTFGINAGAQKIAQFKAQNTEWQALLNEIAMDAKERKVDEINDRNREKYLSVAKQISEFRNKRIASSVEMLKGFKVEEGKDTVESVYHVLMTSKVGQDPRIYVGEISYDPIDIENIKIIGCTSKKTPTNFSFTDGKHNYKYTSADSQLLMDFNNKAIIKDEWPVQFVSDPYALLKDIAQKNKILPSSFGYQDAAETVPAFRKRVTQSFSWLIVNEQGEVERYSGFNSFYALGTKEGEKEKEKSFAKMYDEITQTKHKDASNLIDMLKKYVQSKAPQKSQKIEKEQMREHLLKYAERFPLEIQKNLKKLLFRPMSEMYIPIPNAKRFHELNPDFFVQGAGKLRDKSKLLLDKEERKFSLMFEPSTDCLDAYICQDFGKAIMSYKKQTILGDWILRKVFQLDEYEPLTAEKLSEIGINGIRLFRVDNDEHVHLTFIEIDKDNLPDDYWSA